MKFFAPPLLALLFSVSVAVAQDQDVIATPTWEEVIADGILPYRQLRIEDIPVNDQMQSQGAFRIVPAIEPRFHIFVSPVDDVYHSHVDLWLVFSGLDTKQSSRKSSSQSMAAELPYAQALLDINEIHARKLADLSVDDLPQVRAKTPEEAKTELEQKLKSFLDDKLKKMSAEMKTFATTTKNGQDKKQVAKLGAEIKKRLDATRAVTVPYIVPPQDPK